MEKEMKQKLIQNTLEIKKLLSECMEGSLRKQALENIDNILELLED